MIRQSFLLAAVVGLAAPATAHNAWLLPSTTVLSDTAQSVTVDMGASTAPFEPNHQPLPVENVQVWAPDGTMGKIENAARGRYRSTFDVRIDKPGTWRIGMENSSITGTFKVDGAQWMVGRRRGPMPSAGSAMATPATPPRPQSDNGRPQIDPAHIVSSVEEIPAGATDLALVETIGRNEFFVSAGNPSDAVFKPGNKGLEFVPITLPTDLVANEPGQFRFLVDGKPAAGLEVEIIPNGRRFRDSDLTRKLKTDAQGLLTVEWPSAGIYWLNATLTDNRPSNPKAGKRRMTYTATLEVPAP